jgi:hypothetical protein
MSTIRNDEESLLERVETLLKQNPKSQEDILRHLQTELVSLRAKSDTKTIETVFQAFGTAVGTDSKRNLTLNGAAANFDAEGWQTPLRETGILAFALEAWTLATPQLLSKSNIFGSLGTALPTMVLSLQSQPTSTADVFSRFKS